MSQKSKELQRWFHSLLVKKLGVDPYYFVRLKLIADAVFFEPRIQFFDGLWEPHV